MSKRKLLSKKPQRNSDVAFFCSLIDSPLGRIKLTFSNQQLQALQFVADSNTTLNSDTRTKQVKQEINRYFKQSNYQPEVSLELIGTPFQLKVWQALRRIPAGKTLSYGELAKQLKTSPRAIGQACRTNPVPIIIPCHRVIARKGLGGYAGQRKGKMMAIKEKLLALEGVHIT